jgi:hypothetical protein
MTSSPGDRFPAYTQPIWLAVSGGGAFVFECDNLKFTKLGRGVAILTWLSSWSEKAKLLDAILAYTLISPIHFRKPRSLFLKDTNAHDRIRIVGIDLSLCNE